MRSAEPDLLNKSLCLATAVDLIKFVTINAMNLNVHLKSDLDVFPILYRARTFNYYQNERIHS